MINDDDIQALISPAGETEQQPMPPAMATVDAQIPEESASEAQGCDQQKRNSEQAGLGDRNMVMMVMVALAARCSSKRAKDRRTQYGPG